MTFYIFFYRRPSSNSDPLADQNVRLRLRRQAPGEEQAYQLEIKFPTKDSNDVTNNKGQQDRIERLIQSIILEQVRNLVFQAFSCPFGYFLANF